MFATTLVQHGPGLRDAEWSLLVIDSCSDVQISELACGRASSSTPASTTITTRSSTSSALSQSCRNIVLDRLAFGACIGDALRVLGDAAGGHCENVRLTNFVMDTGGHPTATAAFGLGSRSGVSLRAGIRKLEIGHGFLRGARSSPSRDRARRRRRARGSARPPPGRRTTRRPERDRAQPRRLARRAHRAHDPLRRRRARRQRLGRADQGRHPLEPDHPHLAGRAARARGQAAARISVAGARGLDHREPEPRPRRPAARPARSSP